MKINSKRIIVILFASLLFVSCGKSTHENDLDLNPEENSPADIDLCRCLTEPGNSEYMQKNNEACRDAISRELGVENWEKVNMSQNPAISAKFDALILKRFQLKLWKAL